MRLEHHLVGGYVRYISPHIIIIIIKGWAIHLHKDLEDDSVPTILHMKATPNHSHV